MISLFPVRFINFPESRSWDHLQADDRPPAPSVGDQDFPLFVDVPSATICSSVLRGDSPAVLRNPFEGLLSEFSLRHLTPPLGDHVRPVAIAAVPVWDFALAGFVRCEC